MYQPRLLTGSRFSYGKISPYWRRPVSGSSFPTTGLTAFYPLTTDADDTSGNGNNLTNEPGLGRRLNYTGLVGAFIVGELIFGIPSGGNGTLISDTGSVLTIIVIAPFANGDVITGGSSGATATVTTVVNATVNFGANGTIFEGFNYLRRASLLSAVPTFSVSFWLTSPYVLMDQGIIADNNTVNLGAVILIWGSNGNYRAILDNGDGFQDWLTIPDAPDNTLQFVCLVYDGMDYIWYFNNNAPITIGITGPVLTNTDFFLGTYSSTGSFLIGNLQYVGVWKDVVLSPSDVVVLYNGGVPLGP